MLIDPRLYLAIDNCFASKRWSRPEDWASLVKSMGIRCIEASADNECDPLYTPAGYQQEWSDAVRRACLENDVKVVNCYSGHGSYSTLGLAHYNKRVREHMAENWLKPFFQMAAGLEAGTGFFCHAFPHYILQNKTDYDSEVQKLCALLKGLNEYCRSIGGKTPGLEQMYAPHQYPWRIKDCFDVIKSTGMYITLDTGHQTGQYRYMRPDAEALMKVFEHGANDIWLGADKARAMMQLARSGDMSKNTAVSAILEDISMNPHLFCEPEDCDLYAWVAKLGCYSPIIHLQQTNGRQSSHRGFVEPIAKDDIVHPAKILKALAESYRRPDIENVKKAGEIYLTLELFFPTSAYYEEIISAVKASIAVWRKAVPHDGMLLSETPALTRNMD